MKTPDKTMSLKKKVITSFLVLLLGVVLGVFSKWLDNLSINDTVWWQHIIGVLDLGNVFSELNIWLLIALAISIFSSTPARAGLNVFLFFLGMTTSYHLYTIHFSGFNPQRYMMIWYGMTLISPILAFICWHIRGRNKISVFISSLIVCVMFILSFNGDFGYFDARRMVDLAIFVGTILVLYIGMKDET